MFELILFSFWGGFLYRWRGHASKYKKYFPRPFNQILFALPYALLTFSILPEQIEILNYMIALLVWIATTLSILTGHGNGHDLGSAPRGKKDETLEFVVKWLHGKIPEYWYDVVLMFWLGVCITLSSGLSILNPVLMLSGALRGPAYMLGWFISNMLPHTQKKSADGQYYSGIKCLPRHLDEATALGEGFTGLFLYVVLGTYIQHCTN